MTKKSKNIIKFYLATAATGGLLYFVSCSNYTIFDWRILGASICTFIWYYYHVFTDN